VSPSPKEMTDASRVTDYGRAWADVMQRVRQGYSWSGNERNCAFVSDGKGGFESVSAASGFDFPDDGRAMALVDWDQDGDLDVWMRNRSAPRLRLLLNQCESDTGTLIRLEGTTSNRDAIGAVVEAGGQTKSVRAGEMFLSQSSKWLHFAGEIDKVKVRWPGGAEEVFETGESRGHFIFKEGEEDEDTITSWHRGCRLSEDHQLNQQLNPGVSGASEHSASSSARIIFPARVPMPEIRFRDKAAQLRGLPSESEPFLLVLWSASCEHCVKSLKKWSKSPPKVPLLALSVDTLESGGLGEVYALMDQLQPSFTWGMIEEPSLAMIGRLQEALFDGEPPLVVPMAFLLDGKGNAVAQYRGSVPASVMEVDAGRLPAATALELHHWAAPIEGTWFTNPVDQAWFSGFVRGRITGSE